MNSTPEQIGVFTRTAAHPAKCGDPRALLAHFLALLEKWDEAKKTEQIARVTGDREAVAAAEMAVTARLGDILAFKEDTATVLAMALRWLQDLFPYACGPLRDLLGRVSLLTTRVDEQDRRIRQQEERLSEIELALVEEEIA